VINSGKLRNKFCVKAENAEKGTKQYKNQKKSTFAGKILNILYVPMFPIWPSNYYFSLKTSSDRLKLVLRTKKKIPKKIMSG
jgi:hypothetical protein